jgi:hypothetical protein
MKVTTLRLPEGLYGDLKAEAAEQGLSFSEYARELLQERDEGDANTNTTTNTEVLERLEDLEERVAALEEDDHQQPLVEHDEPSGALQPESREDRFSGEQSDQDTPSSDSSQLLAEDISEDVVAAVEEAATGWEDAPDRLEARKTAAALILQHAIETNETVGKSSDVVADVRDEYPVENQSEETYWRKNVRPLLKRHGEYHQGEHGYRVDSITNSR